MPKKEIVNVNMYDAENGHNVFKDGFLVALSKDSIQIKGNKIYLEIADKILVADLQQFAFVWNPSFEHIFGQDFRQLFQIEKVSPGMMRSLYEWTNPIFDQFPIKIKAKDEFSRDLQDKLQKDKGYYSAVRNAMLEQVRVLNIPARRKYLDRFIPMGILT